MISGVSSYSSYSSYSSTLASSARNSTANSTAASCSGGPAKAQEKLFSILDSNGDGSVAKEELDSALSAAKESDSSLTIDIDELFSQLDANSDGSIDKEETAALAPPPPHGGPGGPGGANPEELFGQLDSDGDGSVGLAELSSALGVSSDDSDLATLFGELDSDADGVKDSGEEKLSRDEFTVLIREGMVGSLFTGIGAEAGRRIQQVAMEESRLKIPLLFAADVIHGLSTLVENAADFAGSAVRVHATVDAGWIEIEVLDDGPGFAPEILPRLGEPYVTSRPQGKARLALAAQIAAAARPPAVVDRFR